MSPETHPIDALVDLMDGRLSGDELRAVEQHVRSCSVCQHEIAMLTTAKQAATRLPTISLPPELESRVLASLEDADHGKPSDAPAVTTARTQPVAAQAFWRWVASIGLAAAVLVSAFLWLRPADLPAAAAAHVADYTSQRLSMDSNESDALRLQGSLQSRVSFPLRVFDLQMMGYSLAGGRVLEIGNRTAAAWVYRGTAGWLLCEMFLGRLEDLPRPDDTRVTNDFTFYVYHRDNGTQVFWEEGDVLCVLASQLPSEDVIQLAIAKAMKPQ